MEAIGIDLGVNTSKICRWRSAPHSKLGEGPFTVEFQGGTKYYSSRIFFKDKTVDVCEVRSSSKSKYAKDNIIGYKPIVGSSDGHNDSICKNAKEDHQRSYYTVNFNSKTWDIDAELAQSLVLQFLYYLFLHDDSMKYEEYPFELSRVLSRSREVVIAIPEYYTESNIRGLEVALTLAHLGSASFLRESVAVALDYGYYKAQQREFPAQGRTVLFCDMGRHCTTVTIVQFFNDRMNVLKSSSQFLGGADFDEVLIDLLRRKLREKKGLELPNDGYARFQLQKVVHSIKEAFTVTGQSTSVCVPWDDEEYELEILREDLEEACNSRRLFERFFNFVCDALRSPPALPAIDSIEIVGGSMLMSRLHSELLNAVQDRGMNVKQVSRTMDIYEACARGCALFAQKGLVERKIRCGVCSVGLNGAKGAQRAAMAMYGCKMEVEAMREGVFTIETNDTLQKGHDHDWNAILRNGAAFFEDFQEVCRKSAMLGTSIQQLQQLITSLRATLEGIRDRSEFTKPCERDLQFLEEQERRCFSSGTPQLETLQQSLVGVRQMEERWEQELHSRENERKVGKIVYRGDWRGSQRHGLHRAYNERGQLLFVAEYRDDKLNGKKRTVDPDSGVLLEICEYQNDQRHGRFESYYPSRDLKEVCRYVEGNKTGMDCMYYKNGQLKSVVQYDNGRPEGYFGSFYENGQLEREGKIEKGRKRFLNCFHRNGAIQQQCLFDAAGEVRVAFEFDQHGDLTYAGNLLNGEDRDGPSILFYTNRFYAHCMFVKGQMVRNGEVVPPEQFAPSKLNRDFAAMQRLDTRFVNWRPIEERDMSLTNQDVHVWTYDHVDHPVLTINYETPYDCLRQPDKEEHKVFTVVENGQRRLMDPLDIIRSALTYTEVTKMEIKQNSLFGDLLWKVGLQFEPTKSLEISEFYPSGVHEAVFQKAEQCRKMLVRSGFVEHDKDSECSAVLYYNNGVKRREGKMRGKKWVQFKEYLNTGKEVKPSSERMNE